MPDDWTAFVADFCAANGICRNDATLRLLGTPSMIDIREDFRAGVARRLLETRLRDLAQHVGLIP